MDVLVTYDVNTETREGRRRLRRVAKVCEGTGQRVQMSVFECTVSPTEFQRLRQKLLNEIDSDLDSLRIYRLAGPRERIVEALGRDEWRDMEGPLVL